MEETRQKLFLQLFVMATVVSLSLILTVYIASTYYKGVADLSVWTPAPSDTPTTTTVVPTQPTPTRTSTQQPTATPTEAKNCTYSGLYWFYHPEAWPDQMVVDSLTYSKEEAISILQSPNPDTATRLFTQLHAAVLNYMHGANFDAVHPTTIEASKWLIDHPAGSQISEADQQTGLSLTKTLEDYNNGLSGPGHCADEPAPPAPTDTPVPQFTPTPTETVTETPYPTLKFVPSNTPKKSRPQATRPPATNPPKPPTEKPPTPVP